MKASSKFTVSTLILLALLVLASVPLFAQGDLPDAEIVNDEGGVQIIVGEAAYESVSFSDFSEEAVILLSDSSNFYVDRNRDPDYTLPLEAQVLGQFTSDRNISPFSYRIFLPIIPPGESRDVDNDGQEDQGVVVMDVSTAYNLYGDAYLEDRDGGSGLSSLRDSPEFELLYEPVGGKFVIWSPDDQQGFPASFGEDGRIFTEDDPTVRVPAGYTVVNMDTDPFTFDRAQTATVDLYESVYQPNVPSDFSDLTYSDAFEALIDLMRNEYAFTEYKNVDWDALLEEFLPRFEEAERNEDQAAYQLAVRDFTWAIPDGHIGAGTPLTQEEFATNTAGGLGISIAELDDGRVIVSYLVNNGPAEDADIELGAEILEINGQPIGDAISATVPFSSPFSNPTNLRLQQLRYVIRFPLGTRVEVTYQNPGASEPETVTLDTVEERESFNITSFVRGAASGEDLPIEFEIREDGYGYIRINRFGEPLLMLDLWERILGILVSQGVPGVIIDMRQNSGGYSLGNLMASYFFDEEVPVGVREVFTEGIDDFYADPVLDLETLEPPVDGPIYRGRVAILVGPACASACEFFSYSMSLQGRSAIVGQYPTAGLGGNIAFVNLPDGVNFQFTVGRALNAEGDIRLEGFGVVPTVDVPVDEETVFSTEDVVLNAAVEYLDEATEFTTSDGGELTLGEPVQGTLVPNERVRYTITVPEEGQYDFVLETDLPTVIRIYIAGEDEPRIEVEEQLLEGVQIPAGLNLVIEIGGAGDVQEGDFTFTLRSTEEIEVSTELVGDINIGDTVEGELARGQRLRYRLIVEEEATVNISLTDAAGEVDTYLRVYDESGDLLAENDDIVTGEEINSLLEGLELGKGVYLIEVGTFEDRSEGAFTLTVEQSN
ncbi:MAG: S41 family peptidase [bacterium]|nr:S41 family peptidase [bacterium]